MSLPFDMENEMNSTELFESLGYSIKRQAVIDNNPELKDENLCRSGSDPYNFINWRVNLQNPKGERVNVWLSCSIFINDGYPSLGEAIEHLIDAMSIVYPGEDDFEAWANEYDYLKIPRRSLRNMFNIYKRNSEKAVKFIDREHILAFENRNEY